MKGNLYVYTYALIALCFLSIFVLHDVYAQKKYSDYLQIVALDVGQGSSMYVRTQNNIELLADTGPSAKILRSWQQYRGIFDRAVDYVIISHMDSDHMAMLPRIISEYNVANLVITNDESDNGLYEEAIRQIQKSNTRIIFPIPQTRQYLDRDVHIEYLWPYSKEVSSLSNNDASIVFRLVHKDISVLFAGDITKTIEKRLVEMYGGVLQSDVLFVSHHGSKTSSHIDFLRTVSPRYAVIQSGEDNRYGHPHTSVLDNLKQLGIVVLRNDQLGNIHFISDGEHLLVQ